MISAKKIGGILWDYFLMTVGCLIFVMGWTSFLLPNEVTSGGLTGLCAVLQYATNDKLQVAYTFPAINAVLIITATFVLGKSFGFRTIYAIAVSSLMFEIMPRFEFLQAVPGNFLYLDEKILVPVIGSVMEGIGIGLILMRGGSTGGTDIAAMIIGRFWPITPGTVYIIHDLAVIGSLLLIPGKTFQDVVYGYISMLTFSFMLDYVILGQKSTVQLLIFSSKYPEIADYINNKMERGATVLKATGWYTKVDRDVLLVIVRKSEVHEITKVIKQLDPKAFLSISPANSVYGEGFEEIKAGLERKKKNAEAQN